MFDCRICLSSDEILIRSTGSDTTPIGQADTDGSTASMRPSGLAEPEAEPKDANTRDGSSGNSQNKPATPVAFPSVPLHLKMSSKLWQLLRNTEEQISTLSTQIRRCHSASSTVLLLARPLPPHKSITFSYDSTPMTSGCFSHGNLMIQIAASSSFPWRLRTGNPRISSSICRSQELVE